MNIKIIHDEPPNNKIKHVTSVNIIKESEKNNDTYNEKNDNSEQ